MGDQFHAGLGPRWESAGAWGCFISWGDMEPRREVGGLLLPKQAKRKKFPL